MSLTLFSVPKAFEGQSAIIQDNAIRSWKRLGPDVEVIVYGDEPGTADAARRIGVRHVPELECNEYGTPLIDHLFRRAQQDAIHDWLCYVNCDIVLTDDLLPAVDLVAAVPRRQVLMSGRRWRVGIVRRLEFDGPEWCEYWRPDVAAVGVLDSVQCMDYFVFPRGLIEDLPAFAIGRTRWSSYLPHQAMVNGAIFVDATEAVFAVHQNHEFRTGAQKAGMRKLPDALINAKLVPDEAIATLGDATHRITPRGSLRRAHDAVRLRWWIYRQRRRPVLGLPLRIALRASGAPLKARLVR